MKKLYICNDSKDLVAQATVWFTIVTVLNKGISLITQPIINRILTVEQVGVVNVYMTWSQIFSIFATFNLFCGVLEVLLTKNKEDTSQIVGSLLSLSIVISLVFFSVVTIFIYPICDFLELRPIYLLIMGITIVSQSVFQFWSVPKRFEYSYKEYTFVVIVLSISKAVLTIVLSYVIDYDRVLGRILGLLIPEVVMAIIIIIRVIMDVSFKTITQYWLYAIKFNTPLIPHYLSSILLASSDKIMIQKMIGEKQVGLYSIAYSYASLGLIIFNALNSAYTPFAFQKLQNNDYMALKKRTNWLMLLSVLTASVMCLLAPEALYILGGKKYLEVLPIIPGLVFGVFLSSFYYVFSNVEFVHEKTKYIFPITLTGGLLNVVLNIIFIPIFGYQVAAYTTIVGYLVISICHYIVSCKILKKNIYDMANIFISLLILIVICFLSSCLYAFSIARYLIAGILFVLFFKIFYRNNI